LINTYSKNSKICPYTASEVQNPASKNDKINHDNMNEKSDTYHIKISFHYLLHDAIQNIMQLGEITALCKLKKKKMKVIGDK
jgi:hypothetical protein